MSLNMSSPTREKAARKMILETRYVKYIRRPDEASNTTCSVLSSVDPYELFCVRTRLVREVEKATGQAVDVRFQTDYSDHPDKFGRVHAVLEFSERTPSESDVFQRLLDRIQNEHGGYCLLYHSDVSVMLRPESDSPELPLELKRVPSEWLREMLRPVVEEIWEQKEIDYPLKFDESPASAEVYVALRAQEPYDKVYNYLVYTITRRLKYLYKRGALARADKDFCARWKLEPRRGYFVASWQDLRIAEYVSEFLMEQRQGSGGVLFPGQFVLKNYRTRAEGCWTRVFVDSIEDAWRVAGTMRHYSYLRLESVCSASEQADSAVQDS